MRLWKAGWVCACHADVQRSNTPEQSFTYTILSLLELLHILQNECSFSVDCYRFPMSFHFILTPFHLSTLLVIIRRLRCLLPTVMYMQKITCLKKSWNYFLGYRTRNVGMTVHHLYHIFIFCIFYTGHIVIVSLNMTLSIVFATFVLWTSLQFIVWHQAYTKYNIFILNCIGCLFKCHCFSLYFL